MCGIVGAVARREIQPLLLEGLRRLEYRGYDSAGVAVLDANQQLRRTRVLGKVAGLAERLAAQPGGHVGIAHTRWATHGEPSESNAHPHVSGDELAIVHNGIIENHAELRGELESAGYRFSSATDSEVIAHLIHREMQRGASLLAAVETIVPRLEGAFAIAAIAPGAGHELVAARRGSPLVVGLGDGAHFLASDVAALLTETRRFIFLEEGDIAQLTPDQVRVFDCQGKPTHREDRVSELSAESANRGGYKHYMLKEIFEQPVAIQNTLEGRLSSDRVLESVFNAAALARIAKVRKVHIIACGTSFHAGLVASYWLEISARIPCTVDIASEYRYRQPVVSENTLFVAISQSGETADTLAALRLAKQLGYLATIAVCNVPESSIVREADIELMTRAGPEIGVASTKAFTTQLTALLLLTAVLTRISEGDEAAIVHQLRELPALVEQTLTLDGEIARLAQRFGDKHHALFLGRGAMYPLAMEGALKLKEISYIHAEAYAAGELKHGPLALVDSDMPVMVVAPNNQLLEKLKSNMEEVRARGGELFVFADAKAGIENAPGVTVLHVPHAEDLVEPIVYSIPLQLLAYHVAVIKGTDIDQPRNLAKSVTVE